MKVLLQVLFFGFAASVSWGRDLPVSVSGAEIDPFKDAKSETLVFVFVEEVCPISNRYVPMLNELEHDWRDRGVEFLMVYPGSESSPESVRKHREDFKVSMPCLIDRGHFLVARSQATVTPECAVFKRGEDGRFVLIYHGRIDDQYLKFGKWRREASQHDLKDTLQLISKGRVPEFRTEQAVGCYISES